MTDHHTRGLTPAVDPLRRTAGTALLGGDAQASYVVAPGYQQGAQILLAEDDDPVRLLLMRVLRRAGYSVIDAVNGAVALDLIARMSPPQISLLITDVSMPQLGGLELARRLREAGHVQLVIFITGYAETGSVWNDEHTMLLSKPFTPRTFIDTVSAMLARQAPRANTVGA
jgi:CheY-like chemotaxis protein